MNGARLTVSVGIGILASVLECVAEASGWHSFFVPRYYTTPFGECLRHTPLTFLAFAALSFLFLSGDQEQR